MGLDMYLHSRVYVGNKYRKAGQQVKVVYPDNEKDVTFKIGKAKLPNKKISSIEYDIAYWRKQNHIHQWFVENVQGGEDDCKDYYVDFEQIERLVDSCKQVLDSIKTNKPLPKDTSNWQEWEDIEVTDSGLAESLLPTQAGFFFGGTQYDMYYVMGLLETIEQLEPLLKKNKDGYYKHPGELYYRASW